jgi:serine protease
MGSATFANTETDIFPYGGWLDNEGRQVGEKCAWISSGQGKMANVTMNGATFPVTSIWSNALYNPRTQNGCVQATP